MADERFFTKCRSQLSLAEIAVITDASHHCENPETVFVEDIAPLDQAGPDQVSFLDNIRYRGQLKTTGAAACFVTPDMVKDVPEGVRALITDTPYRAFALIAQAFYRESPPQSYRAPGARIHESAAIGDNCFIGDNAVIGDGVRIGNNCRIMEGAVIGGNVIIGNDCCIHPHVSLTCALLGDRVTIFPGARIGQDGFGFAIAAEGFVKMPQLGRAIIENDVVIGANTTIDRGSGPDTVIDAGTWIDNLVQIGHNVKVGRMCIIAGQAGVAGSAQIGDRVMIGGQSGITGHITIGNDARIAGGSGVMRDVEPGGEVMGYPALDKTTFMRQTTFLRRSVKSRADETKEK